MKNQIIAVALVLAVTSCKTPEESSLLDDSTLAEPLTIDAIGAFLAAHPEVVTIEALLAALPPNFRTSPVYVFDSTSRQKTRRLGGPEDEGFTNPRAILFSE